MRTEYFQVLLEDRILDFFSKFPNFLKTRLRPKKSQVGCTHGLGPLSAYHRHPQGNLVLCLCGDNDCLHFQKAPDCWAQTQARTKLNLGEKCSIPLPFLWKTFPYLASKNYTNQTRVQVSTLIWPLSRSCWQASSWILCLSFFLIIKVPHHHDRNTAKY